MHQAVIAQLAGRHLGTHDTKTRGEVRGGGAKPYRQKGTGRARQGSSRAPHYAGGGVVFGPHPRSYEQRLPKRMKRLALRGALSAKFGDGAVKVVEDLAMDEIKTRELVGYLANLKAGGRVLVVAPGRDEKLERSARNLPRRRRSSCADSLNIGRRPERRHAAHHRAGAGDHGGGVRMTLQASQVIVRPVISEKSMDETQRGKYTFARPQRRQQAADQGRRRGALQGHRAAGQRPDHEVQGEVAATVGRGRIKGCTSPWKKAVVTVAAGDKIEFFEGV